MKTFDELQINKGILKAVVEMGFTEPTPVQAEVIPLMLNNTDCVALAPTGTGKTCAFGIPLIEMVDVEVTAVQAIIMCPTRELAMQIERELKRLCAYVERIRILAIYGGQNIDRQLFGLRKRPQILVCTPGRLLDHLRRHTITLTAVTSVVLDEADEMLEMGFREDIDTILETVPTTAQVTMFSATMSKDILAISTHYQNEPVTITLNDAEERPDIAQFFVKLSEKNKVEALQQIMTENNYNFVLVFCNTKRRVDNLNTELNRLGYTASALHGDLRQRQRDVVMRSYRAKNISILVATDVAARGIDVDNIEAIFNYDVPNNDEYYLHRIGRTARAKKSGVAYTFATKADFHRIRECEKYTETAMEELVLKGLSDNTITTNRQKSAVYTVRMFVNVGTKDGLTESTFADYIMASTNIKRGEIPEIRLMDIFGFIEVVPEKVDEIKLINGLKIGKRKLAIEVAGERAGSSASRGRSDGSSYDRKPREYGSRSGASSEARRPYGDRPARSDGSSEARRPYGDRPARSEG
ncbi:MAG: DEAD/DEAH box helicase, partial [Clostridia bacterium]